MAYIRELSRSLQQGRLLNRCGDLGATGDALIDGLGYSSRFDGDDTDAELAQFARPLPARARMGSVGHDPDDCVAKI